MTIDIERRLRDGGLGKCDVVNLQRRLFLRHGLSLRRADPADRLRRGHQHRPGRRLPARHLALQRRRAGRAVQSAQAGADLPREHGAAPSSASTRNTASSEIPIINPATWRLQPSGLVSDKRAWTLEQLQAMPQRADVDAPRLRRGLEHDRQMGRRAAAHLPGEGRRRPRARYVSFHCDDPISYSTSIDMASALHPQTILCLTYAGKPIEPQFGAPMRVKIPTKLGFKQPKFVTEIQRDQRVSGRLLGGLRLQLVCGTLRVRPSVA